MSFSFTWNWLNALEVLGLVLAVIGFLNLSEKLEDAFGRMREASLQYAAYKRNYAKSLWPPHKHIPQLLLEIIDSLPVILLCVGGYVWLTGAYAALKIAILSLSWIEQSLLASLVILFLILNELFTRYALSRAFALIAHTFEKSFKLLAIPKSGITGTLGLIIALAAFLLGHITIAA